MLSRHIGRVHRQAIRLLPTTADYRAEAAFQPSSISSSTFRVQDPACSSSAIGISNATAAAPRSPPISPAKSVTFSPNQPRTVHSQVHRGFAAGASGSDPPGDPGPGDAAGDGYGSTSAQQPQPPPNREDMRDLDAEADYEGQGEDTGGGREPEPDEDALNELLLKWETLMDGGKLEADPVAVLDTMVQGARAPIDETGFYHNWPVASFGRCDVLDDLQMDGSMHKGSAPFILHSLPTRRESYEIRGVAADESIVKYQSNNHVVVCNPP